MFLACAPPSCSHTTTLPLVTGSVWPTLLARITSIHGNTAHRPPFAAVVVGTVTVRAVALVPVAVVGGAAVGQASDGDEKHVRVAQRRLVVAQVPAGETRPRLAAAVGGPDALVPVSVAHHHGDEAVLERHITPPASNGSGPRRIGPPQRQLPRPLTRASLPLPRPSCAEHGIGPLGPVDGGATSGDGVGAGREQRVQGERNVQVRACRCSDHGSHVIYGATTAVPQVGPCTAVPSTLSVPSLAPSRPTMARGVLAMRPMAAMTTGREQRGHLVTATPPGSPPGISHREIHPGVGHAPSHDEDENGHDTQVQWVEMPT